MARVTYHGESFEVPDGDATLLDYYRGEGAEVDLGEAAVEDWLPRLFDGSEYIDAPAETEALPDVHDVVVVDAGEPVDDAAQPQQDGPAVPAASEDAAGAVDARSAPQPGPAPDPAA